MHDRNLWEEFSRGLYVLLPFISVDRLEETEKNEAFPSFVGHTCQELQWATFKFGKMKMLCLAYRNLFDLVIPQP